MRDIPVRSGSGHTLTWTESTFLNLLAEAEVTGSTPTRFSVVGCDMPPIRGAPVRRYAGVDRVPPIPTEAEEGEEAECLDEYVFGEIKDEGTNLIGNAADAFELGERLKTGRQRYEVLFVCDGPESVSRLEAESYRADALGYDIAAIQADYWSIVGDFSNAGWARPYRALLNRHGLFDTRASARSYLQEYRLHRDPDADAPFEVVYVLRVAPETA